MNFDSFLTDTLARISESGLSTAEVCREAGIDPSLVSRWKAGAVEPRISSLVRMNQAVDVLRHRKLQNLLKGDA
jgi:transcriptional regulator with XRE-family HTH domain